MIRALTALLASLILGLSGAAAQTASPQAAISESHLETSREFVRVILIDVAILPDMSLAAFNMYAPSMLQSVRSTPFFASLPPERQTAMVEYITNIAPIGQEETMRNAQGLIDEFGPRFAALFSEAELTDISRFMRTEHGRSAFRRSVLAGVTGDTAAFTPEEIDALMQFNETVGGRAFNGKESELGPLFHDLGYAATSAENVAARFRRDLCAIAGPNCPVAWRQGI